MRLTRRAVLLAAAGGVLARPAAAGAATGEVAAVLELIRAEDAATAAYELAARATGDALLTRIAGQDGEHTHALRVQLESLTVPPEHRRPGAEKADPAAERLARTGAKADAIALEERLLGIYASAARGLVDGGVLRTAATIAGSHAQQLAVLRGAR